MSLAAESGQGDHHNPLVTFALLACEQEKFIREAVEGALAQTYSPLEVILADDRSTDRRFEIIHSRAVDYSEPQEIRLNRNPWNLGLIVRKGSDLFTVLTHLLFRLVCRRPQQQARQPLQTEDAGMNEPSAFPEPWHQPWPEHDVETVPNCPVCGEERRELLYADLVDEVFRVAPGKWRLWRCPGCGSAYLDPRPTRDSLGVAYGSYYTHRDPEARDDYESLSPFRMLRRRLVNGYTNWRYSTEARPANALGVAAAFAAPNLKRVIDRQFRHLPRRPKGGGRVLDVGCGDGSFLLLARSCGWASMGVDPDPQAASNSQDIEIGLGGIEYLDGESELFDAITLNHVIEHVYDPLNVLRRCHALLKNGGQLWLETPNIESLGHAKFKHHWRGLEPPRHLVLFNASSIRFALTQAGFRGSRRQTRPDPTIGMFRHSWALEQGIPPCASNAPPKALRRAALWAAFRASLFPKTSELLVLAATK